MRQGGIIYTYFGETTWIIKLGVRYRELGFLTPGTGSDGVSHKLGQACGSSRWLLFGHACVETTFGSHFGKQESEGEPCGVSCGEPTTVWDICEWREPESLTFEVLAMFEASSPTNYVPKRELLHCWGLNRGYFEPFRFRGYSPREPLKVPDLRCNLLTGSFMIMAVSSDDR